MTTESDEIFRMNVPRELVEKVKIGEVAVITPKNPKEAFLKLVWLVRLKWLKSAKEEAEKYLREFWYLNTAKLYPLANGYANILVKLGLGDLLKKFEEIWDRRLEDEFAGDFVKATIGQFPW